MTSTPDPSPLHGSSPVPRARSETSTAAPRSSTQSTQSFTPERFLVSGSRGTGAFSLIEVVMSIGITAFALFAIAGVVPVGMNSFNQAKNTSITTEISRQVFSDIENTTMSNLIASSSNPTQSTSVQNTAPWILPAPTGLGSYNNASGGASVRNFDNQGSELASSSSTSTGVPTGTIYQVNVRVAYQSYFVAGTSATTVTNNSLLLVTIQIAINPGHLKLAVDSATSTLWTGAVTNNSSAQVQIITYQTTVAGDPTPPIS